MNPKSANTGNTVVLGAKERLDDLLQRNRDFDIEFTPLGSHNHVPMVLIALYRLGALSEELSAYSERLSPRKPLSGTGKDIVPELTPSTWTAYLGEPRLFPDYVAFFTDWIRREGRSPVIRACLPMMIRGVKSAYHAMIRLGYALDIDSTPEIVYALAYGAVIYGKTPEYDVNARPIAPATMLANLVEAMPSLNVPLPPSISARMGNVLAMPEYVNALRPIAVSPEDPLAEMATLVSDVFALTNDFTLLHAVTSCHALRSLLPFIDEREIPEYLSVYWHSVCAAYVTVAKARSLSKTSDLPSSESENWEDIKSIARGSGNDHTIKLAYTCWREFEHYGDPRYLSLARRECQSAAAFV